jgi:hypothetical protein
LYIGTGTQTTIRIDSLLFAQPAAAAG